MASNELLHAALHLERACSRRCLLVHAIVPVDRGPRQAVLIGVEGLEDGAHVLMRRDHRRAWMQLACRRVKVAVQLS